MLQSKLFSKTIREIPKDEKSINSKLLIRAGFIDKLMAGVYSFLPLGFLVLKKIENIIREEMNKISGQEILLPSLHPKQNWQMTKRWQVKEMFKFKNRQGKDFGLGWTHEEILTPLVKKFVKSYKDLPIFAYQIQNKFRDELRVKSGLLRSLEFIMKDLYSFNASEEELDRYYEKVKMAYFRIFRRCGLGERTFLTYASGGDFSRYSHEFQTVTPYGEDEIYLCRKCKLAINKEIIKDEKYQCSKCKSKNLDVQKAIEVGNIFKLKDKFSKLFNLTFIDRDGERRPVLMGCYGIGLGRLMGAIVEVHHDEKGIIWPETVAPFQIHLIKLENTRRVKKVAEKLYQDLSSTISRDDNLFRGNKQKVFRNLQKQEGEVLYDDRDEKSAGEKFMDADLIGIPYRIVLSERTLKVNSVEIKKRNQKTVQLIKINNLPQFLTQISR